MSDTSKRGIPARFRTMSGGINPAAVVSLAEVLAILIEPHLTVDEHRIREGLPVVDDYGWGYPQGDTEGSVGPDSAGVHEALPANTVLPATPPSPVPGMVASGGPSADSELAPRESENLGETSTTTPAVVPPKTRETPVTGTPRAKEIPIPITSGTSPDQVKRNIQWRLKGSLPARCDSIMQTSGSQTGIGYLVAISAAALVLSVRSILAVTGEGRWTLALPVNHIGGP